MVLAMSAWLNTPVGGVVVWWDMMGVGAGLCGLSSEDDC